MDASHLQRSARVLLGSPLSRVYSSEASNQETQKDAFVCSSCFQLLIPGVTCSSRTIGLLGNKASRKKQLARINRFLAKVSNRKGKFTTEIGKKLVITCWSCGELTKTRYRRFSKQDDKRVSASTKGKPKTKTKPATVKPPVPRPGLSLSDFLL